MNLPSNFQNSFTCPKYHLVLKSCSWHLYGIGLGGIWAYFWEINSRKFAGRFFVGLRRPGKFAQSQLYLAGAIVILLHHYLSNRLGCLRAPASTAPCPSRPPAGMMRPLWNLTCYLPNFIISENEIDKVHSLFSIRDSVIFGLGSVPYFWQNIA